MTLENIEKLLKPNESSPANVNKIGKPGFVARRWKTEIQLRPLKERKPTLDRIWGHFPTSWFQQAKLQKTEDFIWFLSNKMALAWNRRDTEDTTHIADEGRGGEVEQEEN